MTAFRKTEKVRMSSGIVSYYIQVKKWYGWKSVKFFGTRSERNDFYNKIKYKQS